MPTTVRPRSDKKPALLSRENGDAALQGRACIVGTLANTFPSLYPLMYSDERLIHYLL